MGGTKVIRFPMARRSSAPPAATVPEDRVPLTPMGQRMYAALDALGPKVTQQDIVRAVQLRGVHNFWRWATGRTNVKGRQLVLLARALQTTAEELVLGRSQELEDFVEAQPPGQEVTPEELRVLGSVCFPEGRRPSPRFYARLLQLVREDLGK